MTFDPNTLFYKMAQFFSRNKDKDDKVIICNEGGSRSSKTWDFIHFIVFYCDHNRNANKEIYVFRDTLTNCKDYTLKEFIKCFQLIGVNFEYYNPQKPTIKLWGNSIFFRGLEDEQTAEAAPSNICFVNEMLDIDSFSFISGWLMRCSELFAADWNPKFSDHWAFDLEKRPNALFTHSTYKNNKHLPVSIIREIEGYEPTEENKLKGTANEYRWKVYGLGERSTPEGLVFNSITWIDDLPINYESIAFGLDFGFTNDPTALVEVRKSGNNLFAKLHLYEPVNDANLLYSLVNPITKNEMIIADSSDKNTNGVSMVVDLALRGLKIAAVSKTKIVNGIDIMNRYKLHIVKNPDAKKEAENYKYQVIRGIKTNIPIDKYNHFWDAFRYVVMSLYRI